MTSAKDVILVTGSSGYIGSRLVERLAQKAQVVGLDVQEPTELPENASFVPLDLTADEGVEHALETVRKMHGDRIASVVHLAAYFDLSGEPDPLYEAVTVRGTERLLGGLQGFTVEQLIFFSTMLVHRPAAPGETIDEEQPLERKFPYRNSKIDTEELIHEKRGDIPVVYLRVAGIYDDGCGSAFLADQISRVFERSPKSHVYPGDPAAAQTFLHIADLTDAVERLIERRRELPAELPLLVGETEAPSYAELQRELGRLIHGEDWQVWQIPKPLAKTGAWLEDAVFDEGTFVKPWMIDAADDTYALDVGRIMQLLDWRPKHSLREKLPEMIERLKADPAAWYEANGISVGRVP